MPFTLERSHRDAAQRLVPLQLQIQKIYDGLGFKPYDNRKGNEKIEDVRAATLLICKAEIANNIIILNTIASMHETIGLGLMTESQWRTITGLNEPNVPLSAPANNMAQYLKLAFVTMFQFRLENMFVNILDIVNSKNVPWGYYNRASKILDLANLEGKKLKLDALMLLQSIRNSLHSNGVHNDEPFVVYVGDCLFDFRQGEKINCASWAHAIVAASAIISIIGEILHAPQIKNLPGPIRDHYIDNYRISKSKRSK